jgi:2-C-methyl-D-erythritol 4-phosphate cytidylyltransferase/2-C-methyl-D-erythritol 2,4-cyclodiphosphate synthase
MIVAEAPRIAHRAGAMSERLAPAMRSDADRISVRATSTDGLGFTGRGEGIAAQAVVLISRPGSG